MERVLHINIAEGLLCTVAHRHTYTDKRYALVPSIKCINYIKYHRRLITRCTFKCLYMGISIAFIDRKIDRKRIFACKLIPFMSRPEKKYKTIGRRAGNAIAFNPFVQFGHTHNAHITHHVIANNLQQ